MRYISGVFLLICLCHDAIGQQTLSGEVRDFKSNEPLEYVNVTLPGSTIGTQTDSLGRFSINLKPHLYSKLKFSLVGYTSRIFKTENLTNTLIVFMELSTTALDEFIVKPKENPAWGIIRRVQNNERFNNPNKYDVFQGTFYSKSKIVAKAIDRVSFTPYSSNMSLMDSIRSQGSINFMITENYGDFYFRKGQQREVTRHTVSSMPKMLPTNLLFSNQLNPLGFYKPFFRFNPGIDKSLDSDQFVERNYINPIKKGTFGIYDFDLIDTLIQETDSIFRITFKPYIGKSADALMGEMAISSDGYALKFIKAEPADSLQIVSFKLSQSYAKYHKKWYPSERILKITYPLAYKKNNALMEISMEHYLSDIKDTLPSDVYFDGATKEVLSKADTISLESFAKIRGMPLTNDELRSYERSLLKHKPQLKKALDLMAFPSKVILQAAAPIGPFVLLFNQNIINNHEKLRIGLGIQNNRLTNPRFGVRATVGYGLWDKAWKYTASASLHITKDRYNRLSLYTVEDIRAPGRTVSIGPNYSIPYPPLLYFNPKGYLVDKFNKKGVSLYFKPIKWTWFLLYVENDKRQAINYSHDELSNDTFLRNYGANFRFAKGETFNRNGLYEVVQNLNYPVININFQKSINKRSAGSFWRSDFRIHQQIRWEKIGSDAITLSAGYASGDIPFSYLYNNLGGGPRLFGQQTDGFIAGDYTSFAYNQYVNLNWIHRFGKNLFRLKTKWSQPDIAIGHRFAWSLLSPENKISDLDLNDFSSGNFEATLYLNNLLRVPLMGTHIGFGMRTAFNYSNVFSGNRRFVLFPTFALALF